MKVKMVLAPIHNLGPFKDGDQIEELVRNNVNNPDQIFNYGQKGTGSWITFGSPKTTTENFFTTIEFSVPDALSDEDLMYLCHGRAFEIWRDKINFAGDYHNCWVFKENGSSYQIVGSTY